MEKSKYEKSKEVDSFLLKNSAAWRKQLPLSLGAFDQAFKVLGGSSSKKSIDLAFFRHCKKMKYIKAIAAGGNRYNLDGTVSGNISDKEIEHAKSVIAKAKVVEKNGKQS